MCLPLPANSLRPAGAGPSAKAGIAGMGGVNGLIFSLF